MYCQAMRGCKSNGKEICSMYLDKYFRRHSIWSLVSLGTNYLAIRKKVTNICIQYVLFILKNNLNGKLKLLLFHIIFHFHFLRQRETSFYLDIIPSSSYWAIFSYWSCEHSGIGIGCSNVLFLSLFRFFWCLRILFLRSLSKLN